MCQTIEMAYPEESGISQGPGHFVFDYLRAAEMVIADSGLQVSWIALPSARMSHQIQVERKNYCIAGAGVTPERAAIGQFSEIFVTDRLLAVVALKSQRDHLAQARDFHDLITQGQQSFLGLQGVNYGDLIAPQLAELKDRITFIPRNTEQMLDMIERGRADYGLVMKTYTTNYLATRGDRDNFVLHSYPDMHRDFRTAFYCSLAVSPDVITVLNQAIIRQLPKIREMFPEQQVDGPDKP